MKRFMAVMMMAPLVLFAASGRANADTIRYSFQDAGPQPAFRPFNGPAFGGGFSIDTEALINPIGDGEGGGSETLARAQPFDVTLSYFIDPIDMFDIFFTTSDDRTFEEVNPFVLNSRFRQFYYLEVGPNYEPLFGTVYLSGEGDAEAEIFFGQGLLPWSIFTPDAAPTAIPGNVASPFQVEGGVGTWSVSPEPTTLTLCGIGIAGLLGYGLRRRKSAAA